MSNSNSEKLENQVKEEGQHFYNDLLEKMKDLQSQVAEVTGKKCEQAEKVIKKKPFLSLLTSVGVGFALGYLFKKK